MQTINLWPYVDDRLINWWRANPMSLILQNTGLTGGSVIEMQLPWIRFMLKNRRMVALPNHWVLYNSQMPQNEKPCAFIVAYPRASMIDKWMAALINRVDSLICCSNRSLHTQSSTYHELAAVYEWRLQICKSMAQWTHRITHPLVAE